MATQIPNNAAYILTSAGSVPATALDKVFVACDTSNGNQFLSSGHDLLVVHNLDSEAHPFYISSAPDSDGRSVLVVYQVGAGLYSFVEIDTASVFVQPNSNLVMLPSPSWGPLNSNIEFLVIMNA